MQANDSKPWAVAGIADHPLRTTLNNELHARPAFGLTAPARVSHLALLSGEDGAERDRDQVAALCQRFGAPPPAETTKFWHVNLGGFRLNWERHTEFSTYTFVRQEPVSEPFRDSAIARVPPDWLAALAGELLVAIHLVILGRDDPEPPADQLAALFASDNIAASRPAAGAATVWTDFRLQGDGFSRILVHDRELSPRQTGRLIQRLLEIETYRMMTLLALPLARDIGPALGTADRTLTELAGRLADFDQQPQDPAAGQALFEQLSRLAAEIERLGAASNYRFSASRAYYALVGKRIEELREQRIKGRAPIQEFMQRRLAPAVRTCESVSERIAVLSTRVSRASDLLRTQVDLALERQNRDLLASMNRRAKLQLRLQQTVEGLSVVVLSYYLVGLIGYALKALAAAGLRLDAELLTGLAVLPTVAAVWLGLRWMHRRLKHE